MLNDLNETLRNEVASFWPEIAYFAHRQADLSWERGAEGAGYILLPDPNAESAYMDHIMSRAHWHHYVHAHSMREGPRPNKEPDSPEHGVVWFDSVAPPEGYDWDPDEAEGKTLDEEMDEIEELGAQEREAFIEEHGRLEWFAHCTSPEDRAVVVALQLGSDMIWDVFREVGGVGLFEAADKYDGPTHPGTNFGDENLLMN